MGIYGKFLSWLLLSLVATAALPAVAAETLATDDATAVAMPAEADTAATAVKSGRKGLVGKVLAYFDDSNKRKDPTKFDFSIVGGPHYSSDTKVGLGIVAAGLYHSCRADSLMMPSNVTLFGDISSVGFYMLGVRGTHITPHDRMRLQYTLFFYSFLTKFWGLGYDNQSNDDCESRYNDFKTRADVELLFNLGRGLYAGPAATVHYQHATKTRRPELWEGEPLRITSPGAGLTLQYDTRDNLTAPTRGWMAFVQQRFYPRFMGNGDYGFSATEVAVQSYFKGWKGAVIAWRLHSRWAYGNVPWGQLSQLGDNASMRGYYPGRYRNKTEIDLTLELRQRVWRRNGMVLWVGAGTVAPSPRRLMMRHVLPNAGIGYRWEFKELTNIRLDFGVGKGETGFIFSINEAF